MDGLPEFFDGSFGALAAAVQEQDAGIAGPAFAFYHRMPTDTADLEVGFPTLRTVEATGDVHAASLPGGRVARVVHAGSFDGLGPAWERLRGWIDEQGLKAGETLGGLPHRADPGHGSGRAAARAQLAHRGLMTRT